MQIAIVIFGLVLPFAYVYGVTLAPGIYPGDGSELIAASYSLGIAHPTGYPLYLLMGKVFQILFPVGSMAFRMNVFSACSGVASLVLLYLSTQLLLGRAFTRNNASRMSGHLLGVMLVWQLGVSESFWIYVASASLYSLHSLLLCALILVYFKFLESTGGINVANERDMKRLYLSLTFLFIGLGMANHLLILSAAIPIMLHMIYLIFVRVLSFVELKRAVLWILYGLGLYLYIPIRATAKPEINWGNIHDFASFVHYLTRQDYWSKAYIKTFYDFLLGCWYYTKLFTSEFFPLYGYLCGIFLLVVAFGLSLRALAPRRFSRSVFTDLDILCRPSMEILTLVVSIPVLNALLMCSHGRWEDIYIWHRYFISGFTGGVLVLTVVMVLLMQFGPVFRVRYVAIALLALTAGYELKLNYPRADLSKHTLLEEYSNLIWNNVPQDGILLADGDHHMFPLVYQRYVEGKRADVRLIKLGMKEKVNLDELLKTHTDVFLTHRMSKEGYRLESVGLLFRLKKDMSSSNRDSLGKTEEVSASTAMTEHEAEAIWRNQDWLELGHRSISDIARLDYFTRGLIGDYYYRLANFAQSLVSSLSGEAKDRYSERVRTMLSKLEEIAPDNPDHLVNIGSIYCKMGSYLQGIEYFDRAMRIDPKNSAAISLKGKALFALGRSDNKRSKLGTPTLTSPLGFPNLPR